MNIKAEQSRLYTTHSEKYGDSAIRVNNAYIESSVYKRKFIGITGNTVVDGIIAIIAEKAAYESNINVILNTWKSVLSEFGMTIIERR